mgnify:CR=1 FL=1|tara:strand:+ start:977 stop:1126 length:150 start_codon:yes stop_codon:yes gene_type:complete
MSKTNNKMSDNFKHNDYPDWVVGTRIGNGKRAIHPYLRKDFIFDLEKKQ